MKFPIYFATTLSIDNIIPSVIQSVYTDNIIPSVYTDGIIDEIVSVGNYHRNLPI